MKTRLIVSVAAALAFAAGAHAGISGSGVVSGGVKGISGSGVKGISGSGVKGISGSGVKGISGSGVKGHQRKRCQRHQWQWRQGHQRKRCQGHQWQWCQGHQRKRCQRNQRQRPLGRSFWLLEERRTGSGALFCDRPRVSRCLCPRYQRFSSSSLNVLLQDLPDIRLRQLVPEIHVLRHLVSRQRLAAVLDRSLLRERRILPHDEHRHRPRLTSRRLCATAAASSTPG